MNRGRLAFALMVLAVVCFVAALFDVSFGALFGGKWIALGLALFVTGYLADAAPRP